MPYEKTTHFKIEFDTPGMFEDSKEHYAILYINKIAELSNLFNIKVSVDNEPNINNSSYCNCNNCKYGIRNIENESLNKIDNHFKAIKEQNPHPRSI